MSGWDSGFRIVVTLPPENARGRPLDVVLAELRTNLEGVLDDPRMHQTLSAWLLDRKDDS